MRLEDLQKRYVQRHKWYQSRERTLKAELSEAEARVSEAQRKLDALKHPHWLDYLVRPIAEALASRFPDRNLELCGPFGLGCRVSVWLQKKGVQGVEDILSLEVSPGDLDVGELRLVDRTTDTGRYPKGSMGEMNGFNNPEHTIPPSATVAWFKKRLA